MQLNLPQTNLNIKTDASGNRYVFDRLRHKYVALTPEEWVRQHFVDFLIEHKGYPAGLMANEVAITLNQTRRRCDTVVMDRFGKPLVIIEYKAQNIPITQAVFDQIVRYNMTLRVRYLIVSNGLKHYCCLINYEPSPTYRFLPDIPDYQSFVGTSD
ncbi:MAG: type I restriction enzyme HsdR N-terminal domain-containing protein [Muribaculum sp.]|nr:type I restriction enzyme HsdR N-terminal domain-containing protein [Muribaculaceae bacterium]MCM1080712.1 type I restriction enzyme HsdR N-terminal domain-containing protein [Muribaculum sp.]